MSSGHFYFSSLDRYISNRRGDWIPFSYHIPVFNANRVDPDQTPRSAASDLGIPCLPMCLFMGREAYMSKIILEGT